MSADLDRFLKYTQWQDDGCLVWTGSKRSYGYGQFRVGSLKDGSRRVEMAHRWLYLEVKGPIPEGRELDHLCRNPSCVNPQHLEAVSHRTNILRGNTWMAENARKTHCPRGHPYDVFRKRGSRECRTCSNERRRMKYPERVEE